MLSLLSQLIFGTNQTSGSAKGLLTNSSSWSDSSWPGTNTWKDKSPCFDLRNSDLQLEQGEQLLAAFFPIEDVKGNQEELGVLKITNLRLIWIRCDKRRVNLSIGWHSVSLVFEQNLKDSQGSPKPSLCVIAKHGSTKYEFIFSKIRAYSETVWSSQDENWRVLTELKRLYKYEKHIIIDRLTPMYLADPYDVVQKVWTAYRRTGLFRSCRSNLTHLLIKTGSTQTHGGEINKLPGEEVIDSYTDIVVEESKGIKCPGLIVLSNIRFIWIADSLSLKNLSIPYTRIESIKLRQGDRISIQTYDYLATSTKRDFKVQKLDNESAINHGKRTKALFDQLYSMRAMVKSKPKFGPESCDECLDYMSLIKPIEHFLDVLDDPNRYLKLDDSRPLASKIQLIDSNFEINRTSATQLRSIAEDGLSLALDKEETELDRYKGNLIKYLEEKPSSGSQLVYSEELGLVIEKPIDGTELSELWRMDL